MNRSLLRGLFVVAVVASFALPAVAQEGGPPFQVNTFTTNNQNFPAVSADAAGGFVVAWESNTQDDGFGVGVVARAFDASGAPRTGEVPVNVLIEGPQEKPAVAAVPDGGFFVAWSSGFLPGEDVFLRRFGANGTPLGVDLPVNTTLFASQRAPSIDTDASGNAVVVWESQNVIFQGNWTILARRYNSAGVPLTGELQVSQTTSGEQHEPVVAVDPQGNFVVTWQALGADGNGNAVVARRFDATGNPLGDQFLVNQNVAGNQERPWVDRDSLGRFVVAWQSYGQDGSSWGVFARRFDAAGTPLSNEFRANTHTPSFQERPAVATAADGRFMVVWQSGSQDGPSFGTFGQRYDANGAAVGPRAGDGAAGTPGSAPAEETGAPPGRGRMALGVGGSLRGRPGDPDAGVARVGGPAREADPRGAASAEGGGGGDRRAPAGPHPRAEGALAGSSSSWSAEAYAALTAEQKEVVLSNLADTTA